MRRALALPYDEHGQQHAQPGKGTDKRQYAKEDIFQVDHISSTRISMLIERV